jgi:hypothetical protein
MGLRGSLHLAMSARTVSKQWQNYIRVIFGDDDRENEEFLDFDLDNIEEAEERYIWQLDVLKLKQQSAFRHVAPLGHIIPILSQPVFTLYP